MTGNNLTPVATDAGKPVEPELMCAWQSNNLGTPTQDHLAF